MRHCRQRASELVVEAPKTLFGDGQPFAMSLAVTDASWAVGLSCARVSRFFLEDALETKFASHDPGV